MPITDPISHTARLTAAARARESKRPDRLFDDPLAATLAGPEGFAQMERLEAAARPPAAASAGAASGASAGENPYIAIRTRFFDDFLLEAVATPGLRQIVLLAAGLDARAFRLDWPPGTHLFELDRPELLDAKQEVLEGIGTPARCTRIFVGVDLGAEWADTLVGRGFDPAAPSAWLVEGLFPYLDEAGARSLLVKAAALAAPESRLGADVVSHSFLESPYTQAYLKALESEHAAWKFGTDAPETFFAAAKWRATVRRPGDDGVNYGRWPYPVIPRGTPGVPETFLVTARPTGSATMWQRR